MSRLWQQYRATLKSPEVEETVDLFFHRPVAFLIAKGAYRSPLTPNQITLASMLLGVLGGLALFGAPPWAGLTGGALLVTSQILDCADGMLARMRQTSSELGRVLDGMADGTTLTAACAGTIWGIVRLHPSPLWLSVLLVVAALLTIHFGILQTVAYDHYKNVYLRLTQPGTPDETLEEARARARAARARPQRLLERFSWWMYLGYLGRQRRLLRWFDPHTVVRLDELPTYDPARAQVYRRHALGPLRWLRGFFGVGSLVLGLALFNAVGRPDAFLVYRLLLLNAIFFLLVWPLQRRASRRAFAELGLVSLTLRQMSPPSATDPTTPSSTNAPDAKPADVKTADAR